MKLYKLSNNQAAQQLAQAYDVETLKQALQIASSSQSPRASKSFNFQVGQKLTYTKASGYKGTATVQEVNDDGTLLILDHSGRYMGESGGNGFKPVQMGMNMFEEMG